MEALFLTQTPIGLRCFKSCTIGSEAEILENCSFLADFYSFTVLLNSRINSRSSDIIIQLGGILHEFNI
ncbi:unnamed protein product [Brassica oleracea]